MDTPAPHTSVPDTSVPDTPTATNLIDHPHKRPNTPNILTSFELLNLLDKVDDESPTIPFPTMKMVKTFTGLPAEMRDAIWKAVSPSGHDAIMGPFGISDGDDDDSIDHGELSSILCNREVLVARHANREALNAWTKAKIGKLFMSLRDESLESFEDTIFGIESIATLWPTPFQLEQLFDALLLRHERGCIPVKTVYVGISAVVCEPGVSPIANSQLGDYKFRLFGLNDPNLPAFIDNCNARRRYHHSKECYITSLQEYWAENETPKKMRQVWDQCISSTDGELSPELVPVVIGTESAKEIEYRAGIAFQTEIKYGKLAYSIQTTGKSKEFFEGIPPHLAFRLLRQKRCSKCWPSEADYFEMLDAVAPTKEALNDHTG